MSQQPARGWARMVGAVAAWKSALSARTPGALEIEQAHRAAIASYQAEQARYGMARRTAQAQLTGGTAVAGVAGTIGVVDLVSEAVTSGAAVYGPSWMWLGTTAVATLVALRARSRKAKLRPPIAPAIPPPPAPALPRDAVGNTEAARLTSLRVQLLQVAPTIERLEPAAGAELRSADAQAAPALNAVVERLAVLDQLMRGRSGVAGQDSAADAAYESALELRTRLDAGCSAYDALLAACARLLAAPDVGRSADEVLGPALDAMVAYAHGLRQSAAALEDPKS